MRSVLIICLSLFCLVSNAQIPPAIDWQRSIGGSVAESPLRIRSTTDGGYIIAGYSASNNGDLTFNNGFIDVWVVKTDAAGTIQWQKSFGGPGNEQANDVIQTTDGGYILACQTNSTSGDPAGNHGSYDAWIIKLNAGGSVQWQRCYGGSKLDLASSICATPDGGYMIGGISNSDDGDLTSHYGSTLAADAWLIKINGSGVIQWQKNYGGTKDEGQVTAITARDGGYLFSCACQSTDFDVSCGIFGQDIWVVKLDNAGAIQWQQCWGGNNGELVKALHQSADDGFIMAGLSFATSWPESYGQGDAFILKLDPAGGISWYKIYGGSDYDYFNDLQLTTDGGYIAIGTTKSDDHDIDICSRKGDSDYWILKLSSNGSVEWKKMYGGKSKDEGTSMVLTSDGGYLAVGASASVDGDVTGNHGNYDWWLLKLKFPGVPVLPSIQITASDNNICPGKNITFVATVTMGGSTPNYQWQVNGVGIGNNKDTFITGTLQDGDIVTCILTSSDPCLSVATATSNPISMIIDASKAPSGFLPPDMEICSYGIAELSPLSSFSTYLWSNHATTVSILADHPGIYWLEVTTSEGCRGRDSIVLIPKECPKGFYMPTAFTPNKDGKNDILKPYIAGRIRQYELIIYDRAGTIMFRTTDTQKGWDGTYKGIAQNGNVFVWLCTYQFDGEPLQHAKGTLSLIR